MFKACESLLSDSGTLIIEVAYSPSTIGGETLIQFITNMYARIHCTQ